MPSLYGVRGPCEGQDCPLVPPGIFMGRETDNDLQLPVAGVSRYHAKAVEQEDGAWKIVDLGSSNGIKVNGLRVNEQILSDGDLIHLGPVVLRFRSPPAPPPGASASPSAPEAARPQKVAAATAAPDDAESRRRRFRDRDREIQRLVREAAEHKRRRLRRLALLLAILLNLLLISVFLFVMFVRSRPGG